MPNIIEVSEKDIIGGASVIGLGSLTAAGVASLVSRGLARPFYAEETVTLSVSATTTTSTLYLLPAKSIIFPVEYYVTTALASDGTSLTYLQFGDASTAERFGSQAAAANAIAAGVSGVLTNHWNVGAANPLTGLYQASASQMTFTITGTAASLSAGAVKVVVYGITFTPPTS